MLKTNSLTAAVVALCAMALDTASADVTEEVANDITISDAAISTLATGEVRLKFKIANDGAEPQYLVGANLDGTSSVSLIYYSRHGKREPIKRLAVLPGEEVNFATSHMQAIVVGLPSDGFRKVPFDLIFENGAASSAAHRH